MTIHRKSVFSVPILTKYTVGRLKSDNSEPLNAGVLKLFLMATPKIVPQNLATLKNFGDPLYIRITK